MFSNVTGENLEQSNYTPIARGKRHYDFVRNVEEMENCFRPRGYNEDIVDACDFVTNTETCHCVSGILNYLEIYLCVLNWELSDIGALMSIGLATMILFVYFISLYVNAKYFLLPNTISLSRYLNMDSYNFGLIVLGIFFNIPFNTTIIFTCFEYNRSDALMHAATFGRMFICFILGLGLLSYNTAFKLDASIFLRELIFIWLSAIYLYASVYKEMINLYYPPTHRKKSVIHINAFVHILIYAVYLIYISMNVPKQHQISTLKRTGDTTSLSIIGSDDYLDPETLYNPMEVDITPWQQFFAAMNPWTAMTRHKVPLRIIMAPFYIPYAFFMPVVDENRKMNGWCKLIACNSCLLFPIYLYILHFKMDVVTYSGLVGLLAVFLLYFLTHPQREPTNYKIASFWGLFIGFASMNVINLEICCILWQFLNYFANTSNDVLVIMAFPLSYIFVEGIFVLALMKGGHRQMALGFVMGTILFIGYSALPVMLFSICYSDTDHIYSLTDDTTTAFVFMMLTLVITVIALGIYDFELRPSLSAFFAILTVIYCIYMMFSDLLIIHPMGTIHSLTVFIDSEHSQWT